MQFAAYGYGTNETNNVFILPEKWGGQKAVIRK
jgi:hypothetical protein